MLPNFWICCRELRRLKVTSFRACVRSVCSVECSAIKKKFVCFYFHQSCRHVADNIGDINVDLMQSSESSSFTCNDVKLCKFNKPFSYSEKESEWNDISLEFVEFSNAHNCDRSHNATQSNLVHKNV